ncbi:U6 snRNA-associated Sm-like protein LSm1 [Tolypocladium ophioglossoides CBS 100239]|uniref:U6 snRNA-associated Sm-like protein LSm1 n=1 Tax=Tolypocladium ophioglossoides (strain CBS 100239) TaxID=1163406 RepID=A0A0L0NJF0_TOLOC|nr:U6 snRNA-associated Sm-like protein LSm1 [Tolypocladium ophioglossoides CBS 100239]
MPLRRADWQPFRLRPEALRSSLPSCRRRCSRRQLNFWTSPILMVVLRDGRKLIGVLRSWDQFANLVLQSTTERIFAPKPDSAGSDILQGLYADIAHGIFLVRGENVLLLGEIDLDKDDDPPPGYGPAELDVVRKLAEEKKAVEKAKEKARLKKLAKIGFEGENLGDIVF